jgi:5'-phosphate synthase pdxT subunit
MTTSSPSPKTLTVGVLALQGAFEEHMAMLEGLRASAADGQPVRVTAVAVRLPEQLEGVDALVLPGGESTTIGKVAVRWGLVEPLKKWVADGRPIWGTCAGMIMLSQQAKHAETGGQTLIGGLDVEVSRNFFGAQVRSFEMAVAGPPGFDQEPYNAVFIRAPAIISVGEHIEVLSRVANAKPADGSDPVDVIIAARKEHILVTAFHPELTADARWHQYFIETIVLPRA